MRYLPSITPACSQAPERPPLPALEGDAGAGRGVGAGCAGASSVSAASVGATAGAAGAVGRPKPIRVGGVALSSRLSLMPVPRWSLTLLQTAPGWSAGA